MRLALYSSDLSLELVILPIACCHTSFHCFNFRINGRAKQHATPVPVRSVIMVTDMNCLRFVS